jgi:hypothetical protein
MPRPNLVSIARELGTAPRAQPPLPVGEGWGEGAPTIAEARDDERATHALAIVLPR